jgi:redox-sensitive bicupin YhaK (pirin superfamily)
MVPTRYAWIQVARGSINVNGENAEQGDGVIVTGESELKIKAQDDAEILLFDLQ